LNLEGYTNLEEWVNELDEKVMNILRTRLTNKIDEWCKDIEALSKDPSSVAQLQAIAGTTHELHIKNQVIYLNPPLEMAQAAWLKQLQRLMGVVCGQARIKSARYEMSLQNGETALERRDCSVLLPTLPDTVLERPFRLIQEKLNFVRGYVDRWLQMQALWDLEQDIVYGHLGDSLPKWSKILTEIKQSRATFDTTETQRDFGLCVIAYANVQGKVAAKYDSWQRDILNRYGSKLGERMRDINTSLSKARQELERQTITGSSTAQAVTFITFVQDLKRKVGQWSPDVTALEEGQRTLEKQRYAFPDDWLHADRIAGEWGAFHEILKRKDATIQEQLAGLRLKVAAEHKVILEKISASQADWDAHKPIQGGIKPEAAINSIQTFETRVSKLNDDHEMLRKAQDALNIAVSEDKRLQPILDEIKDLRAVWLALSGVATQVNEVRDTLWNLVQPRKVRQTLDSIIANMRELPTRMRQYAAYEHVHEAIKTLLKFNTIVTELKGDAMRERHWRHLFQSLRVSYPYRESTLTLGNVYDLDLKTNEKPIKAICEQARGERNLEEYLRTVRDFWTDFNLSLVQYQSKCRLIKGWDDLFSACSEHLNGLTAMKSSPYYRVFDEEAASWDNKLTAIQTLFDVWIDVQRQWVYLEGIFTNNADIKQLLPVESARFGNIDSEFLAAMRKVYKSPLVLDVLVIPGIQKTFERLAEALGKIQKALGEYLERERSTFPRFYFLGDEDLLEIIGNSSDALRVTKHLKKMFAGLASLETSADDTTVVAMTSRDGETVTLSRPIILAQYRKVNDWLARLEKEMKTTLADTLYPVMTGLEALYSTSNTIEGHAIRSWIEAHPAQLVILAIQAAWTQLVQDRLSRGHTLQAVLDLVQTVLEALADAVVGDLNSITRRKCEHLITELVHQRDVTRSLIQSGVTSANDFEWLRHMRFYFDADVEDRLKCLRVEMADAVFDYGFEYLGIPDRLVQTPLTDKCFLTLTQALHTQLGGSPFGPAGTGKFKEISVSSQTLTGVSMSNL
jgi:dynein heavy chain 1